MGVLIHTPVLSHTPAEFSIKTSHAMTYTSLVCVIQKVRDNPEVSDLLSQYLSQKIIRDLPEKECFQVRFVFKHSMELLPRL